MSLGLLIAFALVQAAALVLLTASLAVISVAARRRDARHADELDRGRRAVHDLSRGRLLEEEVEAIFGTLGERTMALLVEEICSLRVGESRERALDAVRGTAWYDRLPRLARSRFWWRRLRAARSIANVAVSEHLLVVHALLDDPTPAVRLAAVAAIERLPSPGLGAALLERAPTVTGAERNVLIETLARSETIAVPVMIERLSRPRDEEMLRVLLDLAGRLAIPRLLPYVIRFASHESAEVRVGLATCLSHFPHPQSAQTLRRLLDDPVWAVRARAAASLGAIGAIEAIDDLARTMCDPIWWVRLRSAIALRLVGPPGIVRLRGADPAHDRFAADMARYILGLDDAAMAEYVGGGSADFSGANLGALAG